MYRVGENPIKRRHHRIELYAVILAALIVGAFFGRQALRADTTISPAPTAVHKTVSTNTVTKIFDEASFTINLPQDWKLVTHYTTGTDRYTFQNTDTKIAGRLLDIYIDSVPATLGINRALSVQANGNQVSPIGDVSDNCASFTSTGSPSTSDAVLAKWNDVPFLCDLGNYERDVVGTVSTDGINKVTLTDSKGQHNLFFAYTDNNINPDFSIFINALQSFRFK